MSARAAKRGKRKLAARQKARQIRISQPGSDDVRRGTQEPGSQNPRKQGPDPSRPRKGRR